MLPRLIAASIGRKTRGHVWQAVSRTHSLTGRRGRHWCRNWMTTDNDESLTWQEQRKYLSADRLIFAAPGRINGRD